MDATCNVQDSIHVFHLVHNMCPGFWVHIKKPERFDLILRILKGIPKEDKNKNTAPSISCTSLN